MAIYRPSYGITGISIMSMQYKQSLSVIIQIVTAVQGSFELCSIET